MKQITALKNGIQKFYQIYPNSFYCIIAVLIMFVGLGIRGGL